MRNNIEGKVVVITGASSGLGEATVRHLSAHGASVVLGARRVDRIQSLADELTGSGGKALAVATDVIHCDQVQRLVDAAAQTYGRIDVMINNAGLNMAVLTATRHTSDPPVPTCFKRGRKTQESGTRVAYASKLLTILNAMVKNNALFYRDHEGLTTKRITRPLRPMSRGIAMRRLISERHKRPSVCDTAPVSGRMATLMTRRAPRDENLHCIRRVGHKRWNQACGYHRRSLAETAISRVKTSVGDRVRWRCIEAQAIDMSSRCTALNRMTHLR
jgi:NAD(P)-dependent dehydrogenase (short-subunit alcohol dehydrogenase family)